MILMFTEVSVPLKKMLRKNFITMIAEYKNHPLVDLSSYGKNFQ